VNVISPRGLASLAKPYADARVPLADWLKTAQAARWTCLVDAKKSFGSADQVGACLVFDIKGNTYRMIVTVVWADQHQGGTLFVKHFLTHAEYDKDTWKGCCDL
jgi:mRNA interferase HigB